QRLDEHQQLTLVVDGTARNHALAMRTVDELRLEGRAGPQFERVRRLHVVMAVEQDAWGLGPGRTGMVAEHDRMAGRRLGLDLESKIRQLPVEPTGGAPHCRPGGGAGADA